MIVREIVTKSKSSSNQKNNNLNHNKMRKRLNKIQMHKSLKKMINMNLQISKGIKWV